MKMNKSEQFVHDLARKAFMSIWTYPSPIGKNASKELCDVLVVCQPDVIIFSVKEIELKVDGDPETQIARWKRRAVDESVIQIRGAERRLRSVTEVTNSDGSRGVDLGPLPQRAIRRIAVALGSGGAVPFQSKDYGGGFVHVFDEQTIWLLLKELDSISDLVEYLDAREELLSGGIEGALIASEEDLLAAYFIETHTFDELKKGNYHLRILTGSWDEFAKRPEYKAKKVADEVSYVWDRLIDQVNADCAEGKMEFGGDLASIDAITRIMAREPRLLRRMLAKAFLQFLGDDTRRSRLVAGQSGSS